VSGTTTKAERREFVAAWKQAHPGAPARDQLHALSAFMKGETRRMR
jgi:hypothetical protein